VSNKTKSYLVGGVIAVIVIFIGVVLIPKEDKTKAGGFVPIEIGPEDKEFLNQVKEEQPPQAPDASYGGSAIEQSPEYDLDTWMRILEDELE